MSEISLNISDILQSLIRSHNISESELARKVALPKATINRLVSGKTPDPRASTLSVIATYFGISVEQLLGKHPINNANKLEQTRHIPIINSSEIRNWEYIVNHYSNYNYIDTIESDNQTVESGKFAFRLKSDAMWPQFHENTLLIIDPLKTPENRDFVLAYIHETNDVVFRQLILEGGTYKFLVAINNSLFPNINLSEHDKIIGTVIQTRKNY